MDIVEFIDKHKWELIFAVIGALLFGILYEVLKKPVWVTTSLLVPLFVLIIYTYNIRTKDALTSIIGSLEKDNIDERRLKIKKLIRLINQTAKYLIIWKVWSAIIADLERCMSNERDPTARHWIALAIGEIGGSNAIKALCKAFMKEENPFVLLGVVNALDGQGSISLEMVHEQLKNDPDPSDGFSHFPYKLKLIEEKMKKRD